MSEKHPIQVGFDDRASLLQIVHLLADPGGKQNGIDWNTLDFSKAVRRHFEPYKGHTGVALYRSAVKDGLDHGMALQLVMFSLNEDLSFDPKSDFWSPWGEERGDGRGKISELLAAMSRFSKDAQFEKFFEEQKPVLKRYVELFREEMQAQDHAAHFQEYTGLDPSAGLRIVICPFLDWETSHVDMHANRAVTFWGVTPDSSGQPLFQWTDKGSILWHEWGHMILDLLAEQNPDGLKKLETIYPDKTGPCRGSLKSCVQEHCAQALGLRMARWVDSTGRGEGGREPEPHDLPLIESIALALEKYENERERYPKLSDFYSRWMDAFLEPPVRKRFFGLF